MNTQSNPDREWALVWLRGIGQIMLMPSAVTGFLFLVGIGCSSAQQLLGAVAGALVSTVTGSLVRVSRDNLLKGYCGLNGALVGIATYFFFAPTPEALMLLVVGSALSTLVMIWMLRRGIPFYTWPFVVSTWIVFLAGRYLDLARSDTAASSVTGFAASEWLLAPLRGIGQVMFQQSALSGALFLIGIALCSWRGALWTLVGSISGCMLGMLVTGEVDTVMAGLFGFNAALAALAVSLLGRNRWEPVATALLTVPIWMLFRLLHLPALTAPFVLATWLAIRFLPQKR